jgi:hypothetical protein
VQRAPMSTGERPSESTRTPVPVVEGEANRLAPSGAACDLSRGNAGPERVRASSVLSTLCLAAAKHVVNQIHSPLHWGEWVRIQA